MEIKELNKLIERKLKEKNKALERATDFERRYGNEKSYGEAILKEQEVKERKQKKINKLIKLKKQ